MPGIDFPGSDSSRFSEKAQDAIGRLFCWRKNIHSVYSENNEDRFKNKTPKRYYGRRPYYPQRRPVFHAWTN